MGLLLKEVAALYREALTGEPAKLPDLAIQYGDYAAWQRSVLSGERLEVEMAWWREALAGIPEAISLPFDRPRPKVMDYWGGSVPVHIPADVTAGLKALAGSQGATLFMVLDAAFAAFLHRIGGDRDIVIGTAVAGRPRSELEPLAGFFVNTIALRHKTDGLETFTDFLSRTRQHVLEAFQHQTVPFETIVEAVSPVRSLGHAPIVQVMLVLQNTPDAGAVLTLPGIAVSPLLSNGGAAKFDLALNLTECAGGLVGTLSFACQLFDAGTAERLVAMFARLLSAAVAAPETPVMELPLLDDAERRQLVHAFNDTAADYPEDKTVMDLFAEQVSMRPEAVAVIDGECTLTYSALDAASNRLARHLIDQGVGPEQVVGVCLDRSAELIVTLLAIWKAGGAYLPLDPDYPEERLAYMTEDARAYLTVTTTALAERSRPAPSLLLDAQDTQRQLSRTDCAPLSASERVAPPSPEGLAYVIYTSGSTGRPKGVLALWQGLENFLRATTKALAPGGIGLSLQAIGFDTCVEGFVLPLIRGGKLVLVDLDRLAEPGHLRGVCEQHSAQFLHATPTTFRTLLGSDWRASKELTLLVGGEALSSDLGATLSADSAALWNRYGPAETTISAVEWLVPSCAEGTPPIGRPLPNMQIYVVDARQEVCPVGIPGELLIGGVQVARGYVKRPDLTAEKFVADPFSTEPGARLYRTGDLARWRSDGTLEFLGRIDHQVKIRGMRVELGEIEAQLDDQQGVRESVVVTRQNGDGDASLVAYLVPEPVPEPVLAEALGLPLPELTEADKAEALAEVTVLPADSLFDLEGIRSGLSRILPDHMVPTGFVGLTRLPLTASGKTDRKALPDVEATVQRALYVAPQTEMETAVAEAIAGLLNLERVGLHDDFFALGGHSLLAVRMIARLQQATGRELPLRAVFEAPTVERLAAELTAARDIGDFGYAPLMVSGEDPFAPFPLTDVQTAYYLGRQGGGQVSDVSCYGFVGLSFPALDVERLAHCMDILVAAHPMLRTVFAPDLTQRVLPEVPPVVISVTDWSDLTVAEADAAWSGLVAQLSRRALKVDQWPLFEMHAVNMPGETWRLTFGIDRLICDAVSTVLAADQLFGLYFGALEALSPPSLTFGDVVLHDVAHRESARYRRAEAYWHGRLMDLPEIPALPLAATSLAPAKTVFERRSFRLPVNAWDGVRRYASGLRLTPTSVLVSAYAAVLATWSRSDSLLINLTVMDRKPLHEEIDSIVGDFTKVSLLEVRDARNGSFEERTRRLQQRLHEDLEHLDFTGVEVLRALSAETGRTLGKANVVFTSTLGARGADDVLSVASKHGVELLTSIGQTPQVLIDCQVSDGPEGLLVVWDAPSALFSDGVLDDMFAAYRNLIEGLPGSEGAWQADGRLVLPQWQADIIAAANATEGPLPHGRLQDGFFARADLQPGEPALLGLGGSDDGLLSYGELASRSLKLANELRLDLRPDDKLVAIVMAKGWEQVVAALAILEAGAAFLPVSLNQPDERIGRILSDADVRLVLTTPDLCDRLSTHPGLDVLAVNEELVGGSAPERLPVEEQAPSPTSLAYVIYTSGSTGRPKGVMISHRAALNTLLDLGERFSLGSDDRVLWVSDLSFDLSIFDLFGILGQGGAVVVPTPGSHDDPGLWVEAVARYGVTVWNSVPQLAEMAVIAAERSGADGSAGLQSLRLMMLSGDWLPVSLPDRVRLLVPDCHVSSLGGATEASIWSILYPIGTVDANWTSIPYGKPLRNQTFHVLKEDLSPCPMHVTGKLFIGGLGLADGYLGDQARTAERFILHPGTGERLYDTGDLGRYLPSGDIEFLGRDDFQVKIRGYRIELAEIDAALTENPQVEAAVTVAVGERDDRRLVSYVVPKVSADAWDPTDPDIIRSAAARAAFTLEGHGRPPRPDGTSSVALPSGNFDTARREAFLARQSYRSFDGEPLSRSAVEAWLQTASKDGFVCLDSQAADVLSMDLLGQLFASLQAMPVEGALLDKRLYPSAGGLYPVRAYLIVPAHGLAGLEPGVYAYDPVDHCLVAQPAGEASTVAGDTPLLALIGHLPAIQPLYGAWAAEACRLEAGYMASALSSTAAGATLVAQEFEDATVLRILGLDDRDDVAAAVFQLAHGQPGHAGFADNLDLYLFARNEAVNGLSGGLYQYDQITGRLIAMSGSGFAAGAFGGSNAAIFEDSSLAVVAVTGRPSGGPGAQFDHVACGLAGQRLSEAGNAFGIGLCTVGGVSPGALDLGEASISAMHVLLAGPTTALQRSEWRPVEMRPKDPSDPFGARAWLADRLPSHMIPSAVALLEQLPLTPTGKVDRRALPEVRSQSTHADYVAPRTATEELVASIFVELLDIDRAGVDDDFFALGGHSLLATRLVGRLEADTGKTLEMRRIFETPTVEGLAAVLEDTETHWTASPLTKADRSLALPLSYQQERLWFLDRLDDAAGAAYHVETALELTGPLDIGALGEALRQVVKRHEGLRTVFVSGDNGWPVQAVAPTADQAGFAFDEEDISGLDEEALAARIRALLARPFDLASGPLFRAHLLVCGPQRSVLVVGGHHAVLDGWSVGLLLGEVAALYREAVTGELAELPDLTVQYGDYAAWQRSVLSGERLEAETAWWRETLEGIPGAINLPFDRPRPRVMDYRGGTVPVYIPADVTEDLKALAGSQDATLFMVLDAAFAAFLHRIGGDRDIVIGTAVAGRPRPELEPLAGFFVNTIALRHRIDASLSFRDHLAATREAALECFEHQTVPFETVVEATSPVRSLGHAPVVQVMLVLQNTPDADVALTLPGVTVSRFLTDEGAAKFDLALSLTERADGLSGRLTYASQLFDIGTAERLVAMFVRLLGAAVAAPETPVMQLPLSDEAERHRLVHAFNGTAVDYHKDKTVIDLFAEQVGLRPDAVAVVEGERALTYAALDAASNRLARHLIDRGIGPELVTGVCLERSAELIVSLLAILKAGGAYLPLDPRYPEERLAFMLEDANAGLVVATTGTSQRLRAAPASCKVMTLDHDLAAVIDPLERPPADAKRPISPQSLAYVIYTSGSTGHPKGVCVGHSELANFSMWTGSEVGEQLPPKTLLRAPIGFDASGREIWWPLAFGGSIVCMPGEAGSDLIPTLQEHQVDSLCLVPSLLEQLLEDSESGWATALRRIYCGGEALTEALRTKAMATLGGIRLINGYGPSETTLNVTFERFESVCGQGISIGSAIANTQAYIVDPVTLEPQPMGVSGELLIGGVQVARGYINRPGLTAEKFVADPFSTTPGARLYRTGDLARWRSDGTIEFLGRVDHQVKIRGMRVELGEIEAQLNEQQGVRDSVVVTRQNGDGDVSLFAYVVPESVADPVLCEALGVPLSELTQAVKAEALAAVNTLPAENLFDLESVRSGLRRTLPDHMVPARYVGVTRLPLTSSGKIDRKALPEAEASVQRAVYVAPQTDMEIAVAEAMAELLKLDRVGLNDDFFALGGHSLLAVRLIALLEKKTGNTLPVRKVFDTPTVSELASRLSEGTGIVPTQAAIDYLIQNPELKESFDEAYGSGSADKYLSKQVTEHG